MKANIWTLFPTPVYYSSLNTEFSKNEIKTIEEFKKNSFKNEGNITSNDTNVLENKNFKKIKQEIFLRIHDYFDKIICPSNKITPYITQSWLNYTETNQYHHKHEHSNSLVSGVLYINCNDEVDKIKFFNEKYQIIKPEIKEYNIWNSESWSIPVKTGDLLMFPSSLTHMVENKIGNNTRISLAFNVFIKGTLGFDKKLNKLNL